MHHPRKPSLLFWAAVAAAAAMVVGGLGPWTTTLHFSTNGTDSDGWVMIATGAFVGAHLAWTHTRSFSGKGTAAGLLLAGGIVAATAVYDITDISAIANGSEPAFLQDVLNPGWGIYVSLAAGVALSILALAVLAGEVMFDPVPDEPVGA
jgi:hypothetical protein